MGKTIIYDIYYRSIYIDGNVVKETKIFFVEIKAGSEDGQQIKGNKFPPSDVVFVVREKPNSPFRRGRAGNVYVTHWCSSDDENR